MDSWLTSVRDRLASEGFVILDDIRSDFGTFPVVARRTRFEWTKFGFSETFFLFREFDRLTTEALRSFSFEAYRCAKRHKKIPLPCGLYESVWSYAVAVAAAVDEPTLASVRSDAPPKHWSSAEIPIVYDLGRHELAYFEKTPSWGAVYWAGFRKQIRRLLGEEGRPEKS